MEERAMSVFLYVYARSHTLGLLNFIRRRTIAVALHKDEPYEHHSLRSGFLLHLTPRIIMTHRQRSCLLPSPTLASPRIITTFFFLQCQMLATAWRGASYIYRLRSLVVASVLHPTGQLTSQPAMMILIRAWLITTPTASWDARLDGGGPHYLNQ